MAADHARGSGRIPAGNDGEMINMDEAEKIVLRIQKAILVVYPAEVIELVRDSPALLMKALQRGKHEHRAEKEQQQRG